MPASAPISIAANCLDLSFAKDCEKLAPRTACDKTSIKEEYHYRR